MFQLCRMASARVVLSKLFGTLRDGLFPNKLSGIARPVPADGSYPSHRRGWRDAEQARKHRGRQVRGEVRERCSPARSRFETEASQALSQAVRAKRPARVKAGEQPFADGR